MPEQEGFEFGLPFARFMPLNADKTLPTPGRILGYGAPFDFSQAGNAAAVPLVTKIDNADEQTVNVDLSGVSDSEKVTLVELVAAINTASPTDFTASIDADSQRVKIACSKTGARYVQVFGECAQLAGFGQGFGLKFLKANQLKTLSVDPTVKDSETIETTNARGEVTNVVTTSYRNGFTAAIVNASRSMEIRSLIEGGKIGVDADGQATYETPTSKSKKTSFLIQAFYAKYAEGSNKEADMVGYIQEEFRSCEGAFGSKTHGREFSDSNYSIIGTSYRNEAGEISGDTIETELSLTKYAALDVENV